MNLKELAGKVKHAVQGAEESASPEPRSVARPFTPEAPGGPAGDLLRPPPPLEPLRAEIRPGTGKDVPREAAKPEPRRPDIGRTDTRTFAETEATGRAVRWKAQATVPDLAAVYKEAGIESPLHGYGVDKLTEMLSSSHLASATREVRATAAQVALEAARVPLRDIIDDALLRSKALAAFEADKAFDLQALQMRTERRAQVLREQVESFRKQKNGEIEELRRTIDAADQALAQLRARKRREEERLHRIVSHFVEPRPAVSTPPPVAARPPAPPAPPAPSAGSFGPSAPSAAPAPVQPPAAGDKGIETQPVPAAIKPLAPLPSPPAPAKPAGTAGPTPSPAPSTTPATETPEPAASAPAGGSKTGRA